MNEPQRTIYKPEISMGNLLSILTMITLMFGAWFAYGQRLALAEYAVQQNTVAIKTLIESQMSLTVAQVKMSTILEEMQKRRP